MRSVSSDMTRILHLSDPHFGAVEPAIVAKFVALASAMKPDITVLSGDLTMRARPHELSAARAFVEQLPKPLLMIPGNHDVPLLNQPFDRFFRPFHRYHRTFERELEPELITGSAHVVGLNSARAFGPYFDWSEGRVSREQLARVENSFAKSPEGRLRILVTHHPLLELPTRRRAIIKPLKPLLETIEAAKVDLVMCGHFHLSQILLAGASDQWRAVISQAPTVTSTRLKGEPQGFHEFAIGPDRIEAIHHHYKDEAFVPARRFAFIRGEKGWNESPDQEIHSALPIGRS